MSSKPRIRVNDKGDVTAVNGVVLADGIANVITGLGQSNAKTAATRYVADDGWAERDEAYRASTWYSKIVNIPAADAVREWRSWQAEKDQIELLEAEESRLGVRLAVYNALKTARHTGGAVILPTGLPGFQDEPLPLNRITKASIKSLVVLGSQEISPGPVVRDPESEWFGKPEYWTLNSGDSGLRIHPSRVVLINGRKVPGKTIGSQNIWGDSIWVQMADSIRSADNVAGVIDALLHEAKVDVVRIKNLVGQMASGAAEQAYIKRWIMVAQLKSISNVLMLDGEDEHAQKEITWTGLSDIAKTLLMIMAGAADIPVTRLTGEQQSGLSGSDSGSIRNYYDGIRSTQELEYTPALATLDEMLIRSALGTRPPEIWYSWNPLWSMNEKERAEIDKLRAEETEIYERSGLIPQKAMAEMVQNRLIESESWPGADTAYSAEAEALGIPSIGEEAEEVSDAAPRTLYVRRDVLNAKEIIAHFKAQGFKTTLPASDMHVTIAYSRRPLDWMKVGESWVGELKIAAGGPRIMEAFGDQGQAKVLLFKSNELEWRHASIIDAGATWDHLEYQPHITISYDPDAPSLDDVKPWVGEIILGPEIFEEVNEDWQASVAEDGQ